MKLSESRSRSILEETGQFITAVCDTCAKGLGSVRWTRKDEQGEWCSRECRDGAERALAATERIARKGGRPKKHETNADRQRAYRQALRNPIAAD